MAKTRTRRPNTGPIGQSPTQSQKLIYVASKLGINISGMQGSTVNLFDTVNLSSTPGRQTLTFFNATSNKSENFTNFQQGTLNAGETLVIEKIKIWFLILTGGGDLTQNTTAVSQAHPLCAMISGMVQYPATFHFGTLEVKIANQTVVKSYQANETHPAFNRQTTGIAYNESGDSHPLVGQTTINMDSPPVVPMNQKFLIAYSFGPLGTVAANAALMMSVGEFGSIYASKTTL